MTSTTEKKFYTEINESQQDLIKLVIHLNLIAWPQSFKSFYNTNDTSSKIKKYNITKTNHHHIKISTN